MVKVLIVDDEPIIRTGLQKVIKWEELGCVVVGIAENGVEAYGKAKELGPELIISDIKMPKMDGLELAERLEELEPDIKVILLTGYKEFEYARKAVEFGVCDYILKPVDHQELRRAIKRAASEIEKRKAELIEKETLAARVQNSLPILRDKFIGDLLFDNAGMIRHVYERLEYFDIYIGNFIIVVLEMERSNDVSLMEESMQQLTCFTIEEIRQKFGTAVIPFLRGSTVYCIINGVEDIPPDRGEISKYFEQLAERISCYGDAAAFVGVSQSYRGPFFLKQAREEAQKQIEDRLAEKMVSRNTYTVEQAVAYMKENSGREVTLEEVADHVYVSKWYFCKLFKKEMGVNFSDYMAKLRIEQAQKCIRENPALRNYEVAELLGFGNVRYFSQLFKKVTGKTPSEFRG